MAGTASSLTFEGLFESNVLGTFRIIRGFAGLKDLAEISVAYEMEVTEDGSQIKGQQRTLDTQHARSIKNYLATGEQRFLPEVILTIRTDLADELDEALKPVGVESRSDLDGINIRRRWRQPGMRVHRIAVDRGKLDDIRSKKLIRRVDGNHRLALADELEDDPRLPSKYVAPFCLVLLGPPGDAADDYSESLIFHTINSTALPLESEHALRLILGQQADYDMKPEVEFVFSPELHFTRLLRDGLLRMSKVAQKRLGERPLTSLRSAARGLLEMDPGIAESLPIMEGYAEDLLAALDDVVTRLERGHPSLCNADFFVELAARVWKSTLDGQDHAARIDATVVRLEQLAAWLGRDGLVALSEGDSLSKQLLDIFNAASSRIPKRVFLARWYPREQDGDEFRKAKLRLNQILQSLKDIRERLGVDLELVDMGTQVGGTFPIHPRMYDAIASSDIIVVDLTGVRPNVCIEAGYALRHHEQNRLLFIFQPAEGQISVPFDLSTFRYERFSDTGEIPDKIMPHIEEILRGAPFGS